MTRAIAIVSGGMDSVTMAYLVREMGFDLHILSFDYGQRHRKELKFAQRCASDLGAKFDRVDLSILSSLLSTSALTNPSIEVPEGHYASETMKITVVPNRNSIMLSVAVGVAVAEGARVVAAAVHAGDHFIYPDCRPEFIHAFEKTARLANDGFIDTSFSILTPFLEIPKSDIVSIGHRLRVPFELTWSCYKGEEVHCGKCGTCVERREAFKLAHVVDPTAYEDDLEARVQEMFEEDDSGGRR